MSARYNSQKKPISNCAIFSLAYLEDAVKKFESLIYAIKPRYEWTKKFDGQSNMREIATDIYDVC